MPDLTSEEQTELEAIFELCADFESKLNEWERTFVADNEERYKKDLGGSNGYFVTAKMWGILRKIQHKIEP